LRPTPLRDFAFLCAVCLALGACGKKGPPVYPKRTISLRVTDLEGDWQRDFVRLDGSVLVPSGKESMLEDLSGSKVDYARYPLAAPPCEGCPIDYTGHLETEGNPVVGGRYRVSVPLERKEGIYFFEVRLIGGNGGVGAPSNRAKLVVK
jgi:hypothetical protein